jgi:hypothetical protein
MQLINKGLISHPINWLTIGLMLTIAAIAGHLVLQYAGLNPTTDN